MSLAETLRKACAANGLGVSGNADKLLARLCRSGKNAKKTDPKTSSGKPKAGKPKTKAEKPMTKAEKPMTKADKPKTKAGKPTEAKTCTGSACKKPSSAIKKRPVFTVTNAGGVRLSAAAYFYDLCDGKVSRCVPQPIAQPDGTVNIMTIRLVQGAHGEQPRWVMV